MSRAHSCHKGQEDVHTGGGLPGMDTNDNGQRHAGEVLDLLHHRPLQDTDEEHGHHRGYQHRPQREEQQ